MQISNTGQNTAEQQARLRRIVTCIGPNQKNQPNLDLYLVRRYIFSQLLVMVSVSKYLKDTKIQPFMYLYLYLRYISKVSVATLSKCTHSTGAPKLQIYHIKWGVSPSEAVTSVRPIRLPSRRDDHLNWRRRGCCGRRSGRGREIAPLASRRTLSLDLDLAAGTELDLRKRDLVEKAREEKGARLVRLMMKLWSKALMQGADCQ